MAVIQEGIYTHRFCTTIWFNADGDTGEIESIEWDNAHNFQVKIVVKLDREHYRTVRSKRRKGKLDIPPGYYLTRTDDGFDAPDAEKFEYGFYVYRY